MEGGNALADILFGDVCPSGKLPYTVARTEEDYPFFDPDCTEITYEYYHGYCKMDKENKEVAYPFGYGLSYTEFKIGNPELEICNDTAKLVVTVENTGKVKGADVIQLYIGCEGSKVDRPVKVLRDFARVTLEPGECKRIALSVKKDQMAYFDEKANEWKTEDIQYIAYVGDSSRNCELQKVKFRF